MTQTFIASSEYSFFANCAVPVEVKKDLLYLAIFSSQNPLQQRIDLSLVSKEWRKISTAIDFDLGLLIAGCRVKEVILKRIPFCPRSEPLLVKAWTCLFQEKFDLANMPIITDEQLWDYDEEEFELEYSEKEQDRQLNLENFQDWLFSLDVSYRAFIRTADFSQKILTHEERIEILEKLPELVRLIFNETNFTSVQKIQDGQIGSLVSHCRKLEEIYLQEILLSEEGINDLFMACPLLNSLHISGCHAHIPAFFEILPSRIIRLELNTSLGIPSMGLEDFLKRAMHLKVLHLDGFRINDLGPFMRCCPELESLILNDQDPLADPIVVEIAAQCSQLKYFRYNGHSVPLPQVYSLY